MCYCSRDECRTHMTSTLTVTHTHTNTHTHPRVIPLTCYTVVGFSSSSARAHSPTLPSPPFMTPLPPPNFLPSLFHRLPISPLSPLPSLSHVSILPLSRVDPPIPVCPVDSNQPSLSSAIPSLTPSPLSIYNHLTSLIHRTINHSIYIRHSIHTTVTQYITHTHTAVLHLRWSLCLNLSHD